MLIYFYNFFSIKEPYHSSQENRQLSAQHEYWVLCTFGSPESLKNETSRLFW